MVREFYSSSGAFLLITKVKKYAVSKIIGIIKISQCHLIIFTVRSLCMC